MFRFSYCLGSMPNTLSSKNSIKLVGVILYYDLNINLIKPLS